METSRRHVVEDQVVIRWMSHGSARRERFGETRLAETWADLEVNKGPAELPMGKPTKYPLVN